jgi:serine/threonine protein kinase
MKILDIEPKYITKTIAKKICNNKYLLKNYLLKYDLIGGSYEVEKSEYEYEDKNKDITLDGYSIGQKLESGAYGHVYKGTRNSDKSNVAIKRNKKSFQNNTELKDKLDKEIACLKLCVDLSNVIQYKNDFCNDEFCYIVTHNYLNGDLLGKIENPELIFQLRIQIVIGISIGLKGIHEKKIIHRDIKLENIFLDETMQPYIGDFGDSVIVEQTNSEISGTRFIGTQEYTSPETILKYKDQIYTWTQKSDIWSLGILFFTILFNGHSIFDDKFGLFNNEFDFENKLDNQKDCQQFINSRIDDYVNISGVNIYKTMLLKTVLKKMLQINPVVRNISIDKIISTFQRIGI